MTVRMRYKRVRCGISAQAVSAAAALRNVRSIKMSVYKITPSLMYTGVSDTSIDLFESQYPVPHGVTYNSYLLFGEKTVLFDTADRRASAEWLANVEQAAAGRSIDYLVVSHMEPDHSASLALAADKYPDMKIVGNAKTFQIAEAFFGPLGDRKVIVGEGDSLDIGGRVLRFFTAPMVHWPEVMVTFDESDGTLFSADAFGRFGLPDDPGSWEEEARRYYFNIVGKYGSSVQALLKKLSGLEVRRICPLHGPVLSDDLGRYVSLYDRWSSYKSEERGVLIAVASIYGHTLEAADLLKDCLSERGESNVKIIDLTRTDASYAVADAFRYDTLVVAASSYDAGVFRPMEEFLRRLKSKNWNSRSFAVIENGSWAPSAAKTVKALLSEMKDLSEIGTTVTVRSALSEESRAAVKALADAVSSR